MIKKLLLIVVVASGVVLAGCKGDSEGTDPAVAAKASAAAPKSAAQLPADMPDQAKASATAAMGQAAAAQAQASDPARLHAMEEMKKQGH